MHAPLALILSGARRSRTLRLLLALALGLAATIGAARAEDAAGFYAGKTIQLLIGYSPGGGYDANARILARHMGEHIPGHPTVVPQNMPGAGSLRVVNFLYNIAPKDGTVFATFGRGLAMQPLLEPGTTDFDATKLTWIGSITNEVSVCAFRREAGIHTFADMRAKSFTVGGTGSGSDTDIFPIMLRNLFHLRLKLVTGYPGGNDVVLALARGEVDGRCGWSWSSLQKESKAMLGAKALDVPLQISLTKHPDLPNVPLVTDLTTDKSELAAIRLIVSRQTMARPFAAPPGLPPERAAALRAAFDATMRDPAFVAEIERNDFEVRPVSGAEVEALVREVYASPPEVVARARDAVKDQP